MIDVTKFSIEKIKDDTIDCLVAYLNGLGTETKKRFAPHSFIRQEVFVFYKDATNLGFVIRNNEDSKVIAYAILKLGYIYEDCLRYKSTNIELNKLTDSTFAPSVADEWQGTGIGSLLYEHIVEEAKKINIKRIILWGGVQADNFRAVNFYVKYSFKWVTDFERNGKNYDMIFEFDSVTNNIKL